MRLYQWISHGNLNYLGIPQSDFPIWDVAGGDTVKCIMSHIDYGYELDSLDWSKGDIGNPFTYNHNIGTITESGEDGYRFLDVTDCILQDYTQERDLTQYRIAFQINTDWDDLADQVGFTSYETSVINVAPQLFFYLSEIVSVEDENIDLINTQLRIYPSPLSDRGTISLLAKQPYNVNLNIYNIKGQLVQTVYNGNIERGENEIFFDTRELSNGIYLMKATINQEKYVKKIIILK